MAKPTSFAEWIKRIIRRIRSALRRRTVAIDMGACSVRVYLEDAGMIVDEPCLVAYDRAADRIVEVGEQARAMSGRTPADIELIYPMEDGNLSRYEMTGKLIQYYVRQATKPLLRPPRVIITLPHTVSDEDESLLIQAARAGGAGKVFLMESILACAYGSGRDLSKPIGRMVVDIGACHTTAAVISMGGVVVSRTVPVGGNALDEAIVAYVKSRYGLLISKRAGETIKKRIGALYVHHTVHSVEIRGRSVETGAVQKMVITSKEMIEAMTNPTVAIVDVINDVLELTPEALLSDIARDGMILCGGNSLIYGFGRLIAKVTGAPVRTLKDPAHTCVMGAVRAMQMQKVLELTPGIIHLQQQRQRRPGEAENGEPS